MPVSRLFHNLSTATRLNDCLDARLADHTAALEAEKAVVKSTSPTRSGVRESSRIPSLVGAEGGNSQLRSDLAEALRSKGQLQSRLKLVEEEIQRSKGKAKADMKLIKDLSTERAILLTKVRDRDEELKGKSKLLEVCNRL